MLTALQYDSPTPLYSLHIMIVTKTGYRRKACLDYVSIFLCAFSSGKNLTVQLHLGISKQGVVGANCYNFNHNISHSCLTHLCLVNRSVMNRMMWLSRILRKKDELHVFKSSSLTSFSCSRNPISKGCYLYTSRSSRKGL